MEARTSLCEHHAHEYDSAWSRANRVICDFFHRGKVPPRLEAADRDIDFWGSYT